MIKKVRTLKTTSTELLRPGKISVSIRNTKIKKKIIKAKKKIIKARKIVTKTNKGTMTANKETMTANKNIILNLIKKYEFICTKKAVIYYFEYVDNLNNIKINSYLILEN